MSNGYVNSAYRSRGMSPAEVRHRQAIGRKDLGAERSYRHVQIEFREIPAIEGFGGNVVGCKYEVAFA